MSWKSKLVGLCLLLAPTTALAQTEWDFAIAYPAGNYQTKAATKFAEAVSRATGGQVKIQVQSGGVLGFKGPEMLAVIRDGLVPLGSMLMNQQVGVEPLLGIASLPYLASTPQELRSIDEIARPAYDKIAQKHNQKILYTMPWPSQNIFSKNDITKPDDFRRVKIRTVDRNGSDYFRTLGASPAQMPWGEVVPALASGVINSVTTSSSSGVDGQFWEFMKNLYLVRWQTNFDIVTVNLDAWKKLTPANQQAIERVARELEPEFWKAAAQEDESNLKLLSDNGIKLITPTDDLRNFLREKGAAAWDAFGKDVPGAADLLQKYRAATGK